jgi:hypothetical protein
MEIGTRPGMKKKVCGVSYSRAQTYSDIVLSPEEKHLHDSQKHTLTERFAHARAKRICNAPEKEFMKHLLNYHSAVVDQQHYVRVERKDWMPIEWHLLGEELGHKPTDLEKANYILGKKSPSEEYRYYYYFCYPGNIRITAHPHAPDKHQSPNP